mgnify:CR=1 FL=1
MSEVIRDKKFVIITPAYNEAGYIERTIKSVLKQNVQPLKWIIVDDSSTDATAEIIKRYASKHETIKYLRRHKSPGQTYYGSNVYAIMEGWRSLKYLDFEYLAVLDADISLPPDYYHQIFTRFDADEKLGVASGVYVDLINGKHIKVLNDRRSTPKAIQVFRRQCFEQIGGYQPLKFGGEDTCSCVMARMKGWKSWSFPEICVVHNKPVGTGHAKNILKIRFRQGVNEYFMGSHPAFMLVKFLRRCIRERPFIAGGLARIGGFLYAFCRREKRQISDDVVNFIQREQLERLTKFNRVPQKEMFSSR